MDLGFKVVILKPGTKVRMTRHGVKDASNDFATFKRLIPVSGELNIGIATGSTSGVIVFDVGRFRRRREDGSADNHFAT